MLDHSSHESSRVAVHVFQQTEPLTVTKGDSIACSGILRTVLGYLDFDSTVSMK